MSQQSPLLVLLTKSHTVHVPSWLCFRSKPLGYDPQRLADIACFMLQGGPLVVQSSASISHKLVLQRLECIPGILLAAHPAQANQQDD